MSPRSKKEYLQAIYPRYREATTKEQKSRVISELCGVCGYHRKHAIRLLRKFQRFQPSQPRKRGRRSVYAQPEIIQALEHIRLDSGMPCASRMIPIIALWLPHYPGGLNLPVIKALRTISESTAKRLLKPSRRKHKRINISTTKPGSLLRKQIPIKTNQWDEFTPGFLEADTAAHCGSSMAGEFANTVNFVDVATGWTEQRAVFGKGETDVLKQIKNVELSLPFALRGFDSDNGGEFLNNHPPRHFTDNPNRKKTHPVYRLSPIKKTTTLTSNRKTIPTSANCSATADPITPRSLTCSMTFTQTNGGFTTTSSRRPSNSSKKNASAPKSSKNTTNPKLLFNVSCKLRLLTSPTTPNTNSLKNSNI